MKERTRHQNTLETCDTFSGKARLKEFKEKVPRLDINTYFLTLKKTAKNVLVKETCYLAFKLTYSLKQTIIDKVFF